ncbi:hypothetical protein MMC29_006563 [Sticta canariensis]|nr:hypothetical protein [Sticta canariensis]
MVEQQHKLERLTTEWDEMVAASDGKHIEHQGVIKQYQGQLREGTPMEASSASQPRLSIKLPDNLTVNRDHCTTDAIQVSYVRTRTGRDAATHVASRTHKSATKPFKTANEIMDTLHKIMGDPDHFNVFWAEFLTLSAGCAHNEATWIEELENKIWQDMPENFNPNELGLRTASETYRFGELRQA